MSSVLAELIGIGRDYPGPQLIRPLNDVYLSVAAGEYVALVGPGDSGKSTLLHILGLLDTPTRGSYRLGGHETTELAGEQRGRMRAAWIGLAFQQCRLVPWRTALCNVELGLLYQGGPATDRRDATEAALVAVGLGGRLDAAPGTLSAGELQRVAIARAIAGHRRMVLCDEPTGNLDDTMAERILKLLSSLRDRGVAVVVGTRDREVAARADRRLRLSRGRLSELHP